MSSVGNAETEMPGSVIGKMMKLMPSCGLTPFFVLTRQKIQSAHWACVVQIFDPFRT